MSANLHSVSPGETHSALPASLERGADEEGIAPYLISNFDDFEIFFFSAKSVFD